MFLDILGLIVIVLCYGTVAVLTAIVLITEYRDWRRKKPMATRSPLSDAGTSPD